MSWPITISLRYKLLLVVFGITALAIAVLYMYVAPGLENRLLNDKLSQLSAAARNHSGAISATVGTADAATVVTARVQRAALTSGDRVTLLAVNESQGGVELFREADSGNPAATGRLAFAVAYRAVTADRIITGTESTSSGTVGEAAYPISFLGGVTAVAVYSAPVADIAHNVATVRHEILVAGAIALLLALVCGYLFSRALAERVKRLELAAKRVAAGEFGHPIPVDSADELGQLAIAFNDMQHQLEQLDLARKKFIATASHELRTPVFSLSGFVELLEDEELDPETRRRFLDQVRDQVQRLGKLSLNLLDLSTLEAGSLELRPEQVDIGELTRSVSGEFEPTLAQRDSRLEVRLPARRIDAQCDPVRVAQIMRILIDNAVAHTPPGTRIVVTAGRENGVVRLTVRDDGNGIEPQLQQRIFEPFYTADDVQGSGLGLAIASELAGRMSGALSVASDSGATEFTLEIPA
ncbi:MAG: ATP-binding protein [Solirubrobacteraceae bacterium]